MSIFKKFFKTKNDKNRQLSKEFNIKHKEIIDNSMMKYIKISSSKASTSVYDSKIGGNPYWKKNMKYPLDIDDNPMKLLAQINFSDMPYLEDMPQNGLLQFFISGNDDVYGLNFDNPINQDNFRVIYHSNIDKEGLLEDFTVFKSIHNDYFPAPVEAKMIFNEDIKPVSAEDYRFSKYFGKEAFELFTNDECENYIKKYDSSGHKIGGYAFFTQEDPRNYKYDDYKLLLLQLDTDEEINMMWGDCGVANFFIRKEDLLNLDFSKVLYNWDCC